MLDDFGGKMVLSPFFKKDNILTFKFWGDNIIIVRIRS